MMTFEEYCSEKKINHKIVKSNDEKLFLELKNIFECVHPDSFTSQKKFLINKLRRSYLLLENKEQKEISTTVEKPKVIIPKINKPAVVAPKPIIIKPKMTSKAVHSESVEKPKAVALKPKIPGQK